jgi:CRISPR/Cas system CSM-associated protein Csm3 (group 7 of RAMP superfamily)
MLELLTPAHLGNGETVGLTDIPLLRDPAEGRLPLLTGTSLAGALRSYLREYEHGYGRLEERNDLAEQLFGAIQDRSSAQSWLLVDDSLGHAPDTALATQGAPEEKKAPETELRDGVSIRHDTRTAREDFKFDVELLEAGTEFQLRLELLLPEGKPALAEGLAIALWGLQEGEIGLGLRKRRGLGECRVNAWWVRWYDLTTATGLLSWLADDDTGEQSGQDILALLRVQPAQVDQRQEFAIEQARFALDSSLLIRSGSSDPLAPDAVHLRSRRRGQEQPILSGTSLAGALRARALRIALTVRPDVADELVNDMFGRQLAGSDDKPSGSRVVTHESPLQGPVLNLVQSRVKIDRFTGGAYPGALFTEQPAWGDGQTGVEINLSLRCPAEDGLRDAEIGLLLLVLKDLWTGDLPLGGESSIGRGRLAGQSARLVLRGAGRSKEWTLTQEGEQVQVTGSGTRDELEGFVKAFHAYKEEAT